MYKKIIAILLILTVKLGTLHADEGMWLPFLILEKQYNKMQELGLELSAEDIYSINNASLKDAIVGLGKGTAFSHFCSAEIISGQGLILTNYHCGNGFVQNHTTIENNYLRNGFWAATADDELSNPGMTASILIRMEDVTDRVLGDITDDMSDEEAEEVIDNTIMAIEEEAVEGTHYTAKVVPFYHDNRYYLQVHEIFLDVRLVGAPPEDIGEFGGETDNWMWPRHTGDFCLFRIYTAPDGSPAVYDEGNIPYKPRRHLKISLKGVEEGDYAMIMGFPGTTERYLTSWGIEQKLSIYPHAIDIRRAKLDVMEEMMGKDEAVRIAYADKKDYVSNFWKYMVGQKRGLLKLDVKAEKEKQQEEFLAWVAQDDKRMEKYEGVLEGIEEAYDGLAGTDVPNAYYEECLISGPAFYMMSYQLLQVMNDLEENPTDQEAIDAGKESLQKIYEDFFAEYDKNTERLIAIAMIEQMYNNLDGDYRPGFAEEIDQQYGGDVKRFVSDGFETSIFVDPIRFQEFIDMPVYEKEFEAVKLMTFGEIAEMMIEAMEAEEPDYDELKEMSKLLLEKTEELYEEFDEDDDMKEMKAHLKALYKTMDEEEVSIYFPDLAFDYEGDFGDYLDDVYDDSFLACQGDMEDFAEMFEDEESIKEMIDDGELEEYTEDIGYRLYQSVSAHYTMNIYERDWVTRILDGTLSNYIVLLLTRMGLESQLEEGYNTYTAGLMEMNDQKDMYPDANSTQRLTYGTVGGYRPNDGEYYKYYTTGEGILAKFNPADDEFEVPEKLVELLQNKDYGRYGEDGVLPVCFITNNDITGGNSGSPVLNGRGELIGTAFDGNWEAMSGDIAFEPGLQRTIAVDIRYTLFIIDKFAGARRIIDELDIVE